MSRKTTGLMQAGLHALHASGAARLLAPHTRGEGIIFTLHRVTPEPVRPFEPNRILKVTPDFLATAVDAAVAAGYDVVSLDEAARRLDEGGSRFACFTFDDGYRDNRDHAYPVFKARNLPFAIYVPTEYADGAGDLWWLVLEEAIARAERIEVRLSGQLRPFATGTLAEKQAAFHAVYWGLRALPERALRSEVAALAARSGYDPSGLCAGLVMGWDEIRALAADPLVTIGAHTRGHWAVAKLPLEEARAEIAGSVARIEAELGRPCRHFSFPYGDGSSAGPRDFALVEACGLRTGVTTVKNVLHRGRVVRGGLPRVSLNGDYQQRRFVEVMLTGAPFALAAAAGGARKALRRLAAGAPFRRPQAAPG